MIKKIISLISLLLLSFFATSVGAESSFQLKTKAPIYVFGDVHGAYSEIHSMLLKTGLIDEKGQWSGESAQLVSMGDLLDRGPESRKVVELLMRLQNEAQQAGGNVHVILGNHEVMNMVGDLRYVSAQEYAEFSADESDVKREEYYQMWLKKASMNDQDGNRTQFDTLFPSGYFAHREAYSPSGIYGQWLLSLPFVLQINDQVFAHAGLSKKLYGKSLVDLNRELKTTLQNYLQVWDKLVQEDQLSFADAYGDNLKLVEALKQNSTTHEFINLRKHLLFSMDSPNWYRGNAICHPFFESDILANNLAQWNATRLWVGHTPTASKRIAERLNGQLFIVDTGMLASYYEGKPWLAKLDDGSVSFINGISGESSYSVKSPIREYANPYGMSDVQLEEFLLTAEIVSKTTTKEGRTKPVQVTLEKDGKKVEALFKYQSSSTNDGRGRIRRSSGSPDRYQHEVAAYHLDRMLGIGLVPVTVERVIDGRNGSLQIWLDDLINMILMEKNDIEYHGYCDMDEQINFMDAFDYLIANDDRNQSNIMYSISDFQIWFIDHSKSFGITTRRPKMIRHSDIKISQPFIAALKSLDQEKLQLLNPWLSGSQIESLWERRNKMLSGDF